MNHNHETLGIPDESTAAPFREGPCAHWFSHIRRLRWWLASPVLAGLLFMAYQAENRRGQLAWGACLAENARHGIDLDWEHLTPPPVPDQSNAWKAPFMEEWFANRDASPLVQRLNPGLVINSPWPLDGIAAEIDVLPPAANQPAPGGYDLTLREAPLFLVPDFSPPGAVPPELDPALPSLVMDEVPLREAVRLLAVRAGLNYLWDPAVINHWRANRWGGTHEPLVSLRWENAGALEALRALLSNYNLEWVEDPEAQQGTIRFASNSDATPPLRAEARLELRKLLNRLLYPEVVDPQVPQLPGVMGEFVLFLDMPDSRRRGPSHPPRIALRSQKAFSAHTVRELVRSIGPGPERTSLDIQVIEPRENTFYVFNGAPRYCGAAEYLARTARFDADFAQIREASRRPARRAPGDYSSPTNMPCLAFSGIRLATQTLAQRAQAFLLLDQPEAALEELRLVQQVCGMLGDEPSQKSMNLVAAMITVAVTGMSVDVIVQGFQLNRWREPQLRELENLLADVRLAPGVQRAMARERAGICRLMETTSPEWFFQCMASGPPVGEQPRLRLHPAFWYMKLGPRGWVYQNMVRAAEASRPLTDVYDAARGVLRPSATAWDPAERFGSFSQFSPYSALVAMAIPNFVRAWETTARTQAQVDQARIACSLERYRRQHGGYPEHLESLNSTCLNPLPRDLISGELPRYRKAEDGSFRLWCVGWNGRDDGGVAAGTGAVSIPAQPADDWVWPGNDLRPATVAAAR